MARAAALLALVAFSGCGPERSLHIEAAECTRTASPDGSDTAPGTADRPFKSAQRLVDSLNAGQVGCLRQGRYDEAVDVKKGGAPGAPLTLTSYPGERVELRGRLQIKSGADHVTVSGLRLIGDATGVSPAVFASDVTFNHNDVTNDNQGICFNLGHQNAGRADRFTLRGNRIHHCGKLPPGNRDHGVYVNHATGGRILNNVIYANADRGIQLYPNAVSTLIRGNIIDGNGQGVLFGSEGSNNPTVRRAPPSSGNIVEHNVITNSRVRNNVEVSWAGDVGEANVVRRNCLFGAAQGGAAGVQPSMPGVLIADNVVADPDYADRDEGSFVLGRRSDCREIMPANFTDLIPLEADALVKRSD